MDPGKASIIKQRMELTNLTPFKERYRCIPSGMYEEVKAHIQEMLDVGAIHPFHSPWASVIVLVRKEDGKLRFCINLRKLNDHSVKDSYSVPSIQEILECLNGDVWLTSLDLKLGYWQVEIKEENKPLTLFTVGPLGFYTCDQMPFGLINAPTTF